MSGFQYLTRTVHMPVSASGHSIRNSFGVVIATAVDETTATAMADLINLARLPAVEREAAQEAREYRIARMRPTKGASA